MRYLLNLTVPAWQNCTQCPEYNSLIFKIMAVQCSAVVLYKTSKYCLPQQIFSKINMIGNWTFTISVLGLGIAALASKYVHGHDASLPSDDVIILGSFWGAGIGFAGGVAKTVWISGNNPPPANNNPLLQPLNLQPLNP